MSRFPLGKVYFTAGIYERVGFDESFARFVQNCLDRHARGDWGDLCQEDKDENELSIREGFRILSAYHYAGKNGIDEDTKIWIITEADRSVTTVLFPDEY